MAQKKALKKTPPKAPVASNNLWQLSWARVAVTCLTILMLAIFYSAEAVYVQHINDMPLSARSPTTTSNSLKSRTALSTSTASASSLSIDSATNPSLPTSTGNVDNATITQTITSTDVSNMATPGQAAKLPLQQLTNSLMQAGGSLLQAGQGTGDLNPLQF